MPPPVPLHPRGERVSNITEWGIRRINDHYRKEWGEDFEKTYPDGIGAEDIFAYTYAVLHDPVYRYDYATTCCASFPACRSTTSSTSGRAWAASCSTSISASSPSTHTP